NEEIIEYYKPDFLISYNYRYIIGEDILDLFKSKSINLHISLLPWNRGAFPNVWSFLHDTPKGVTIHILDEGIDTGDILIQKEVFIDETKETLASSYNILHKSLQELFKENWMEIKLGKIIPKKQIGKGSLNYIRDFNVIKSILRAKSWDITIRELKENFKSFKEGITNVYYKK
ncbi:formyltransferase family protein, partial [bacterium]